MVKIKELIFRNLNKVSKILGYLGSKKAQIFEIDIIHID